MSPLLDVKYIVRPILTNYNEHVLQLVRLLDKISFELVYIGPGDIRDHIRDKTVYACSIKSTNKMLKNIFPVMIGSRLDTCIRKMCMTTFNAQKLKGDGLLDGYAIETADIAVTLFIINGCVKQLPYFFTNDPTNCHIVSNSVVCCYTYDAQDRGKKLSLYVDNYDRYKRGDQIVSLNDGSENDDVDSFFDHCPYPVRQDIYLTKLFKEGSFDIDHLANKIVVSPGHLFLKMFMKYLYQPLRENNWTMAKNKASMVVKSIEMGTLLHVLSRKTIYHKESNSGAKAVPSENHRELGMNGEVYVEKNSGCYREVKMQTYPLIPYMSHLVVRQISNKVRTLLPYHPSFIGFFCYLGLLEMKNLGRTQMMTKHTFISTQDNLSNVYDLLSIEYAEQDYYVVVNEACIPVTKECFYRIDLDMLKAKLLYVECYQETCFIYIRYKPGLFFKRLKDNIWVTPRDESFWARKLFGLNTKDEIIKAFGFEYLQGHHVDLNGQYFNYNMFAKNLLGFNALKNAILATEKKYSRYFMETLTAYCKVTPLHEIVCAPTDPFSRLFALHLPRVTVGYMSLDGNNQEDCIAVREGLDVFDCYRFYTVRIKFGKKKEKRGKIVYYPVRGQSEDDYLGQVVCHGSTLEATALSIYVRIVRVNDSQVKLYFTKSNFEIVEYILTEDRLIISMEYFHPSGMGDKLCSFHGQKGVLRKTTEMPLFDESVVPDLLVNPYCITTRLTAGQLKEDWDNCVDARTVRYGNKTLLSSGALYGKVFYFPIAYLSSEHIYAPTKCNIDKILGQAVKGRSRGGGMRLGNMEILNGMRGNGLASCFEEKVLEHGDRIFLEDDLVIPKSVYLCSEDAKAYKFNMKHQTEHFITEECKICLEKGADYRTLCCKYAFHTFCLKIWTDQFHKCPSCRATIECTTV